MADTKVIQGGVPHAAEYSVTADQVTILGNGTTEDPLRTGGTSGIQIEDEGVVLPGGPFDRLDFVGLITATDAGLGTAQITVPRGINLVNDGVPVPDNPHNVIDFVGDGVSVIDLGGGTSQVTIPGASSAAPAILTWGYGQLVADAVSRLAIVQGGVTNNITVISPGNTMNIPVPFAGTISNLYVRHDGTDGDGSLVTYTLLRNGSVTVLSVALATGATGIAANIADTFAVNAGDLLQLQAGCAIDGDFFGRITCQIVAT